MKKFLRALLLLAMFVNFISASGAWAAPANGNGNGNGAEAENPEHDEKALIEAAQAMRRAGLVQLNFTDLELLKFVRFMSELLQKNIVVPSTVAGKISVISPKPSTLEEARQIFISVLALNGWSLQDLGDYYKLIPGGGPVPPPGPGVRTEPFLGSVGGEENITQLVTLDYIAPELVVQTLQQAFGQTVMVLPFGTGRDILLQGRTTDVAKCLLVIREIDVPDLVRSTVFHLKYADATAVANQLNAVAQTGTSLRGLTSVPDPASRQVIVTARPRAIAEAKRIIDRLDVAPEQRPDEFHIYTLKNIDATEASEQVGKLLATSAMLQPNQEGQYPPTVVPDLTTNSLIFACAPQQYDDLKKILDTIDVSPKQVLLRGFLAEINVSNLDRAGIDWSFLGGQIWDNFMMGGMAQFGEGTIPSQFMSWFNELSRSEELVDRNGSTYSVTNYEPLALVYTTIEMLKKYDAINVLSVPRLMCTDNKESSFTVGQVIPVLKGTASDLSNPSAMQQNYDYKDTGLTLTVTPHIRSGNVVALDIEQTTEDVLTAAGSVTPVTAKRAVKTSVVVGDGETIILGGMIKETERSLRRRVPGLSAIPLIGNLFTKVSKDREKIDFIIFLTPTIIEGAQAMREEVNNVVISLDPEEQPGGTVAFGKPFLSTVEEETDRRFKELYRKSSEQR